MVIDMNIIVNEKEQAVFDEIYRQLLDDGDVMDLEDIPEGQLFGGDTE